MEEQRNAFSIYVNGRKKPGSETQAAFPCAQSAKCTCLKWMHASFQNLRFPWKKSLLCRRTEKTATQLNEDHFSHKERINKHTNISYQKKKKAVI